MKYLIINPFSGGSSGVDNYTKNLIDWLESAGIEYDLFINEKNRSPDIFRQEVAAYVTKKFGVDDVIIEAPETKAATMLIPRRYKVHVRLHCPLIIAQRYDKKTEDQTAFSHELRAINKASIVSSPSHALIDHLSDEIDVGNTVVYKNPFVVNHRSYLREEKDIDVVFLGRFQILKGIDYINPILERLPATFSVVLIGSNSKDFILSESVRCKVEIKEHIGGDERLDYVGRSKALMMLSRFENCSMVVLEALAVGTVVHAWNVGGNGEIAPPSVLHTHPFEDIDHIVEGLRRTCVEISQYPNPTEFHAALDRIRRDFQFGISSVMARFTHRQQWASLDCRPSHAVRKAENRPIASYSHPFGRRALGFSISNEHIEEMWEPVLKRLGIDRRYVSLRDRGHRRLFTTAHSISDAHYAKYDWIKHTDRLLVNIKNYRPDFLLFHNGLHPSYALALERVKELGIPIIFTELGWFPQKEHIYFDDLGTNGKSRLATLTARDIDGAEDLDAVALPLPDGPVVVALQLENDTNLIVNSPRFKSNAAFVNYLLREIPSHVEIIIKPHPLDKSTDWLSEIDDARTRVVRDVPIGDLLAQASAVVGINSTVLMEALSYNINIYGFGRSLLDNKGVVIDCTDKALSEVWSNSLYGSRHRRDAIIKFFRSMQINVESILTISDEDLFLHPGIQSVHSVAVKGVRLNDRRARLESRRSNGNVEGVIKSMPNTKAGEVSSVIAKTNSLKKTSTAGSENMSSFRRKLRKLKRDPYNFFVDMLKNKKKQRSIGRQKEL